MNDEPLADLDRSLDQSGRKTPPLHEPLLPPSFAAGDEGSYPGAHRAADPDGSEGRPNWSAVVANERAHEPDRSGGDDAAAGAGSTFATSGTRLAGRFGEARSAFGAALDSAGERVRQTIPRIPIPQLPESERVLEVGRTASGEVLRGLQPVTSRVARLFDPLWSFVHRKLFRSRRRTGLLATLVVIAVLLAALLPPLVTLNNALGDYHKLSALGEDGLHHLLAAKDDVSGLSSSLSSSGLSNLNSLFTSSSTAVVDTAPYQYEMQRQSGTDYPVTVTVHASPSMAKAGIGDKQFTATISQSTIFDFGASPKPTPTPSPTPTPTPTPSPSPTPPGSSSSGPSSNTVDLTAAVKELRAANADFAQLRSMLNNPDWILDAVGTIPGTKTRLSTVKALADVGYDATAMGIEFVNAVSPVLHRVQAGALSGQSDLITPADTTALKKALDDASGYLSDIQSRLPVIDLSTLPLTASERDTFTAATEQLPRAQALLQQVEQWLPAVNWVLGVGGARHFLVQTLDKEELRPSGGFTGDYGVLSIANGKLDPLTIKFADNLDYNYFYACGCGVNQRPPAGYGWWPVTGFGLRDSNLSADFPATAKINMSVFKTEGGGDVDGVIQFTTTAIAHVLRVTGPLQIPIFNETITADNLEAKIYYYQDSPEGIARQQQLFPQDASSSNNRKHFLQSVSQELQTQLKHLSTSQLVPLAKQALADMQAKDLQVYVTNTQIENQLLALHSAGTVDARPNLDGYLMVQANVSYNKGTPCVQVSQYDDVYLDDQGGASHRLSMSFYNNAGCDSYSFYTTYYDYVRIYTPLHSRLSRATGWDTGLPLCWAPPPSNPGAGRAAAFANVPNCSGNPYPDGELSCPPGYYGPGAVGPLGYNWGLDVLGPPPQTTSDVAGRTMWGGWVTVPLGCTANVTLRWYVPHIVQPG